MKMGLYYPHFCPFLFICSFIPFSLTNFPIKASVSRPLELCRQDVDCPKMLGGPAKCFRHYERRKVTHGVCVPSIDTCTNHDDCYAKGGKCCNGYCCNGEYFNALADMPCFNNLGCKV